MQYDLWMRLIGSMGPEHGINPKPQALNPKPQALSVQVRSSCGLNPDLHLLPRAHDIVHVVHEAVLKPGH